MRNKFLNYLSKILIVTVSLSLFSACSDGDHGEAPFVPTPTVSVPSISMFQISKVGGAGVAGSSVTIQEGDSVLLEWEISMVENSDGGTIAPKAADGGDTEEGEDENGSPADVPMVSISSPEMGVEFEDLALSGEITVEDVNVDSTFVLTATAGGTTLRREVSAIVAEAAEPLEATIFTGNGAEDVVEVMPGEDVELCWDIPREDASFRITDSEGEIVAASQEDVEGAELLLNNDCITVPDEPNRYSINVDAADGETYSDEIEVKIKDVLEIEYFRVSPSEPIDEPKEVVLSWKVTPEEAEVSITNVDSDSLPTEGDLKVFVEGRTTFTLTATLGDQSEEESVIVDMVPRRTDVTLKTGGSQTIFEGEEATIEWSIVDSRDRTIDSANVTIMGGQFGEAGEQKEAMGSVTVSPDATTEYVLGPTIPNAAPQMPKRIKVIVRSWNGPTGDGINIDSEAEATKSITSLGISKNISDIVYAGFNGSLNGGSLTLAKGVGSGPVWGSIEFPYMKIFPKLYSKGDGNNIDYFDDFEYPINAIATDDSGRMYVGTTGGIFFTDDEGASWETLIAMILLDSVSLPHPTCKGNEHQGWSDQPIAGLEQVCDIAIASDGRVIVASDMLVQYNDDVAAYLEDPETSMWIGEEGSTYGKINHDLELATINGQEVLFVGSSDGLFISMDRGDNYGAVGGNGAPTSEVYAVAVDEQKSVLYAASGGSIYTCELKGFECTSWSSQALSGVEAIYDITIDPVKSGAAFAATDSGVFYTGDSLSWRDVTGPTMKKAPVMSVASSVMNREKAAVYAGTMNGVFMSVADIISDTGDEIETPEESPAEEEGAGEEGGAGEEDVPTIGGDEEGGGVAASDANGMLME